MSKTEAEREIKAIEAENDDLAESRRALSGLVRLGRPWALAESDQLEQRLTENQSKITDLKLGNLERR
jgi:hypothetical protein